MVVRGLALGPNVQHAFMSQTLTNHPQRRKPPGHTVLKSTICRMRPQHMLSMRQVRGCSGEPLNGQAVADLTLQNVQPCYQIRFRSMKYFYTPYPDATNMYGAGKLTATEHVNPMQAKSHAQAWVGKCRARWCEEHAHASGRYSRGTRTQVQGMRTYGWQCR